jgi:hypothetical protein
MVNMCVRNYNTVNFSRMKRECLSEAIVPALLQSAVNKNSLPVNLNTKATPGNLSRRSEKTNLH